MFKLAHKARKETQQEYLLRAKNELEAMRGVVPVCRLKIFLVRKGYLYIFNSMKAVAKHTKPRSTSRQKLVKELDGVFSLYVRMRDGYQCQLRGHLCSCGGVMQCNHLIGRSNYRLRWDELNAVCGCAGHNTWSHYHESDWRDLWQSIYPERVEYLLAKKKELTKFTDWTLKIMIDEFKEKIKELERDNAK